MAFRRGFRRKPTVAWLPVLGQGDNSENYWIQSSIGVSPAGGTAGIGTTIHSLLPDYPAESVQNAQVESLADYQQSGYRLRRVVGKFYCALTNSVGTEGVTIYPEAALVAAGLIVLRVDSTNGAPLQAATPLNYSPLARDNVRDPWIWRRTWLLGNDFADGGQVHTAMGLFPYANTDFGSAWDGPHIDQRTARRVSAEERLFLVVSTVYPGGGITPNTAGNVRYVYEARYLTSPLRVMGNRRNASR